MEPIQTPRSRLFIALMVILLVGVAFDLYSFARLSAKLDQVIAEQVAMRRFPCEKIPTELIYEEPVCVQKLLTWMNITNLRVVTNESQLGLFYREPRPTALG